MSKDYRDTCPEPCCHPQLLYRPADIHDGSELYHRTHAKVGQLAGWDTPPTVCALRQRSGSWGYLEPTNVVFDEVGHVWIRDDAELRPAHDKNLSFYKAHKVLVFWTTYNNVGIYVPAEAFSAIRQRNVSSLKSEEAASGIGVAWRPVVRVVNEMPQGLLRFPY